MRWLLIVALLLAGPASAIAFVQSVAKDCDTACTGCGVGCQTCVPAITTTGGNTVVVVVTFDSAETLSTVTDSGGSTYTLQSGITNTTQGNRVEVWATLSATASTTVTATWVGSNIIAATVMVAEYSGVSALGRVTNKTLNSQTATTQQIVLQGNNNFIVVGNAFFTAAATITAGNARQSATVCNQDRMRLADNTAASPGNRTITWTHASAHTFGAGVELCTTSPCSVFTGVAYVASGTACAVTATTCTPAIPAGLADNDILVAVLHSRTDTAHTCPTNCTGWTEFSTQAGTNGRLSAWWLRRSGAPSNPTFGGPATESYVGRIWAFRGAETSGNPYDALGTNTSQAAAATWTGDALTSTVTNVMTVFVGGSLDDNTWGPAGGSADVPWYVDSGFYAVNTAGTDNSIFIAFDDQPSNSIGGQAAPTNVEATLGNDAGRWFTFQLKVPQGGAAATANWGGFGFWGMLLPMQDERIVFP